MNESYTKNIMDMIKYSAEYHRKMAEFYDNIFKGGFIPGLDKVASAAPAEKPDEIENYLSDEQIDTIMMLQDLGLATTRTLAWEYEYSEDAFRRKFLSPLRKMGIIDHSAAGWYLVDARMTIDDINRKIHDEINNEINLSRRERECRF